jgi:hypothetical protein
MRELPIPPEAKEAAQALEVFRGWIVDNKLQVSLSPWVWKDTPEIWGMLLADVVHHLCNALESETDFKKEELFKIITDRLNDELLQPTTDHPGNFVE